MTTPGTQNPHLAITKVATETGFSKVGDVIHYTIVATNDGNMTLSNVTVTDPNVAGLTCTPANPVATLAPGATINCTATHTITRPTSTRAATPTRPVSMTVPAGLRQACADVTTPGTQNPHLAITKVATETGFTQVGEVIHYTIVATNDGNVTLTQRDGHRPERGWSGVHAGERRWPRWRLGRRSTARRATRSSRLDLDAGSYSNKACVDDGPGGAAQVCAGVTTPATQNPHLAITKVATETGFSRSGT